MRGLDICFFLLMNPAIMFGVQEWQRIDPQSRDGIVVHWILPSPLWGKNLESLNILLHSSLSLLLDEAMYLNVTLLLSSSNSSSSCTGHLKFSLLSGQGDCIFSQSGCSHPSSEGVSSEITSGECYHGVELSKIGKLRLMSSLGVTPKSSPMLLTPSSATPED